MIQDRIINKKRKNDASIGLIAVWSFLGRLPARVTQRAHCYRCLRYSSRALVCAIGFLSPKCVFHTEEYLGYLAISTGIALAAYRKSAECPQLSREMKEVSFPRYCLVVCQALDEWLVTSFVFI